MKHGRRKSGSAWETSPSLEEVQQKFVLTYKEAAVLLSVSERTVWSLVKSGEIPHLKMGTSVRIVRAQVEAWAAAKAAAAMPKPAPADLAERDDEAAKGAA